VAHGQVSTGSLNLLQQLHPLANLPEGDPPAVQNGQRLEADGEVDRFPGACPDIATGEGEDAGIHAMVEHLEVVLYVGHFGVIVLVHGQTSLHPDGGHSSGEHNGVALVLGADLHELQHHLGTGLGEELDGQPALDAGLPHLQIQVDLRAQ